MSSTEPNREPERPLQRTPMEPKTIDRLRGHAQASRGRHMHTSPGTAAIVLPPARGRSKTILLVFVGILLVIGVAFLANAFFMAWCYGEIDRVHWQVQVAKVERDLAELDAEAAKINKQIAVWEA